MPMSANDGNMTERVTTALFVSSDQMMKKRNELLHEARQLYAIGITSWQSTSRPFQANARHITAIARSFQKT